MLSRLRISMGIKILDYSARIQLMFSLRCSAYNAISFMYSAYRALIKIIVFSFRCSAYSAISLMYSAFSALIQLIVLPFRCSAYSAV